MERLLLSGSRVVSGKGTRSLFLSPGSCDSTMPRCFDHGHSVFVELHFVPVAVLLQQILVYHEGQGAGRAVHVFVFLYIINAQPEHDLALSAVAYLGFADADKGVAALVPQQVSKPLGSFSGYFYFHRDSRLFLN